MALESQGSILSAEEDFYGRQRKWKFTKTNLDDAIEGTQRGRQRRGKKKPRKNVWRLPRVARVKGSKKLRFDGSKRTDREEEKRSGKSPGGSGAFFQRSLHQARVRRGRPPRFQVEFLSLYQSGFDRSGRARGTCVTCVFSDPPSAREFCRCWKAQRPLLLAADLSPQSTAGSGAALSGLITRSPSDAPADFISMREKTPRASGAM